MFRYYLSLFQIIVFFALQLILASCSSNTSSDKKAENQLYSPTLNKAQVTEFLQAHNHVRNQHNLQPLAWSNELSLYAQQWANELKRRRCNMQHRPNHGKFTQMHGENLFWASPLRWSHGKVEYQKIEPREVVNDWASEIKYYDYQSNRCQSGQMCGHYTQIVWKSTRLVGCAIAKCNDYSQIWACNYSPPGNYIGERPY